MAPPRASLTCFRCPLVVLLLLLSSSLCPPSASAGASSPPPLQLDGLNLLRPSSLSLSPPFESGCLSYSLSSPTLLSSLSLQPSASPSLSLQLRVNDGPFFSASSESAEEVELLEGVNHVFVQVVREEATGGSLQLHEPPLTYLLTVCNGVDCHEQSEAATPSAQLSSLHLPQVNFTTPFSPSTFSYSALTGRHTHGAVVELKLLQPGDGRLTVASMNGDTFASIVAHQRSHSLPLKMGDNVLFVQVRDAASQLCTYALRIHRSAELIGHEAQQAGAREDDTVEYVGGFAYIRSREASAELSSLLTSVGLLSPRFSPAVRRYSLTVDFHVPTLQLTAKPRDSDAVMLAFITSSLSSSPSPATLPLVKDAPSAAIPLCVGSTSIRVQVSSSDAQLQDSYTVVVSRASEADESDGGVTAELFPSTSATPSRTRSPPHRVRRAASQHSDPTLMGVRGQSYDVHVEAGQVYCLITEPHLQVNARFVNMAALNADGSRAGDAVLGIGELGVMTRTGHRLHLETGTGEAGSVGFSRVQLNEQLMHVDDQALIDNSEEAEHEGDAAAGSAAAELLAFNASDTFTLITPHWLLVLRDTREGIVPRASLTASHLDLGAHGLLGQTWRERRQGRLHAHDGERPQGRGGVGLASEGSEDSMTALEGSIEDYRIADAALFSTNFAFSMYEQEGGALV